MIMLESESSEQTNDIVNEKLIKIGIILYVLTGHLFENETQYKEKISNKTASSLEPLLNKEKKLLWSISDYSILRDKLLQKLINSFQAYGKHFKLFSLTRINHLKTD